VAEKGLIGDLRQTTFAHYSAVATPQRRVFTGLRCPPFTTLLPPSSLMAENALLLLPSALTSYIPAIERPGYFEKHNFLTGGDSGSTYPHLRACACKCECGSNTGHTGKANEARKKHTPWTFLLYRTSLKLIFHVKSSSRDCSRKRLSLFALDPRWSSWPQSVNRDQEGKAKGKTSRALQKSSP